MLHLKKHVLAMAIPIFIAILGVLFSVNEMYAQVVLINEVDADTPGTDRLEFVELYDGGKGNTSLDDFVVVFFDGDNDDSYFAIDLDGYTTNELGYFVLGNAGVSAAELIFDDETLQQGPDAVVLYLGSSEDFPLHTPAWNDGVIWDAFVYDTNDDDDQGILLLLNGGSPQVNEAGAGSSPDHSNQRCSNGSGESRNTYTYAQLPPTPGMRNTCGETNSADLSVVSVEAVQAVEDQPLILDKQTAVKVVVQKTGGEAISVPVQVNYNDNSYSQFYVLNPENTANLGGRQTEVSFTETEDTKVLYFFDTSFTPQSTGQYELSATIDPLNAVNESDEENNTETNSHTVITKDWGNLDPVLRIGLIKTDWDPSLDQEFNEYRATIEELLKGAFPVSDGDVEIVLLPRRSSSKRFREDGLNSTKFEMDNRLLGRWLREESVLNIIFHPRIDRYVHVVPPNWFVDNTEQIGYRVGLSDSGNKTTVLAEFVPVAGLHEVGHTYGLHLPPVCEDYEVFDPNTGMCEQDPERIGTKVELGLWVAKTRPMISTDFRPVYSFMGSVNESLEYWSTEQNYSQLISPPYSPPLSAKASTSSSNKVILAAGEVSITGTVKLDDWYVLENADYDSSYGSGDYVFSFLDESGSEIYTYPFSVGLQHSEADLTVSSFVVKLPYVDGVSEIQVIDSGSKQTLATKAVTQHAPSVNFILPAENQVVDDSVDIEWLGTDQDSEELSYLLTYSGSGIEWQYVTPEQLRENSYTWDTSELPEGNHELSIIASDGVNSSPVASVAITVQHSQTEGQMIFLPFIAR